MWKTIIFSLFAVTLCQAISLGILPEDEIWTNYKNQFNKTYTPQESVLRRSTLLSTTRTIDAINNKKLTYTAGLNKYSDLTNLEYLKYLNGYLFKNSTKTNPTPYVPPSNNTDLPDKVDWREKGYVTAVKDQGLCSSCWAFSSVGSLEGQQKKKSGNLVTLSPENLVDCIADGCDGGWMDSAFELVKSEKGIDTEMSYPYTGKAKKCQFNPSNVGATIKGYVDLPSGDEKALKHAVATVGPISIAIDADSEGFQSYRSGIYDDPLCGNSVYSLTHAILLIGYGTENGMDYWLIKNSWGPTWGMNGYAKLSRNKNNQCGIATKPSYPLM